MNGTEWMALASALGMGLGFLLRAIPNSSFNTKLVPAVITVIMFVKNILIAAGQLPPDAVLFDTTWLVPHMDSGIALAGLFGSGWLAMVLHLILQSAVDASFPVGVFSGVKNTNEYIVQRKARRKSK